MPIKFLHCQQFFFNRVGFTLVEVLVVISIMAILGSVGYATTKSYTERRFLDKAVDELQVLVRQTQSNASSSALCSGKSSLSWQIVINNTAPSIVSLFCTDLNQETKKIKDLSLQRAKVDFIKGNSCSSNSFPGNNVTITFTSLTGAISFQSASLAETCLTDESSEIEINVKTQTSQELEKSFVINKGGAIDVDR